MPATYSAGVALLRTKNYFTSSVHIPRVAEREIKIKRAFSGPRRATAAGYELGGGSGGGGVGWPTFSTVQDFRMQPKRQYYFSHFLF